MRALIAALTLLLAAIPAAAQDAWLQVEARPTRAEAEDRARAYATVCPDAAGEEKAGGRGSIVLGPYPQDEAAQRLDLLRRERMIPADSYLSDGRALRAQFFPAEAAEAPAAAAPAPSAAPAEILPPPESPAEARYSETLLSQAEREDLQRALAWFGFYTAGVDGAFGRGARTIIA